MSRVTELSEATAVRKTSRATIDVVAGDETHGGTWVTFAGGRATSLRVRRCRLRVITGPDQGLSVEFDSPVIRIGGRATADLTLTDRSVSGFHCELSLDELGYRLRDLDSTNGTWVNNLRINDAYVDPSTTIFIGETQLLFEALSESVERPLSTGDRFGDLVGGSAIMRELFARLERIAATDATLLITGETGTGKDLTAEAVHTASPRRAAPFIVLDCGAISANLIESEIFGHEKGAFTGADAARAGAFERAHGGTLFLDEIGELPLDLQPKLLRAIEHKQVRRVGGARTIDADIRLIAATNRDLGVEVSRGRFREDLYYRLAVASVHLPPLRRRKQDIPALVDRLLTTIPGGDRVRLRPETLALMQQHDWPGNVRELRNMVERAVLLEEEPTSATALRRREPGPPVDIDTGVPFKLAKQHVIDEFERAYLTAMLERHGGNVSAVARGAGIDRMSVYRMAQRLGLDLGK